MPFISVISLTLNWHRACLCVTALIAGCLLNTSDAQELTLKNPGFEDAWPAVVSTADTTSPNDQVRPKVTGEVASGWSDNSSWADVQEAYAADTSNPHRGTSAQKLIVTRVGSGAVQFVQGTSFAQGKAYDFRPFFDLLLTHQRANLFGRFVARCF